MLADVLAAAALSVSAWNPHAPLPVSRTAISGVDWREYVVAIGGFSADGSPSARVDAYNARIDQWGELPDLPAPMSHAMVATGGGSLYVFGEERNRRGVFVTTTARRWLKLPSMPVPRAFGGAAFVDNKLYVVGGLGAHGLARSMLVYDRERRRWTTLRGPTPRRDLGVIAMHGWVYAVGGSVRGQQLALAERWWPRTRRWERISPLPERRSETALAAADGLVVSVGGESPAVYSYAPRANRWLRRPDLPTPRRGVAAVGIGAAVYAVGGTRNLDSSPSDANESLGLEGG